MQTASYFHFHFVACFALNFFSSFKLPIQNPNDTILMEGLLDKKPIWEFAKSQGSKIRNLEKFYQNF